MKLNPVASALVITLLAIAPAFSSSSPSATDEQTIAPKASHSDEEVINPFRGLYTWLDKDTAPLPEPARNRYKRFPWAQLEREQGRYDFGPIDSELEKLPKGTKFAFRIMALNASWSWRDGSDIPAYVMSKCPRGFYIPFEVKGPDNPGHLYMPDWNDEFFLQRLDQLMAALGKKYDGDPRIAWVDIGVFGNWGEWHTWLGHFATPYPDTHINRHGAVPATLESRQRIVDAHLKAFRKTRLVMMTADREALIYALRSQRQVPVGIRRDSFGAAQFTRDFPDGNLSKSDQDLLMNRWKTAPFVVEGFGPPKAFEVGPGGLKEQVQKYHIATIGNGNIGEWSQLSRNEQDGFLAAGRQAGYRFRIVDAVVPRTLAPGARMNIRTRWENAGVTPAYEEWDVNYLLWDLRRGHSAAEFTSKLKLQSLLPTEQPFAVDDIFTVPQDVPAGTYELRVRAADPAAYCAPLQFAMEGRNSDGTYTLGKVQLR